MKKPIWLRTTVHKKGETVKTKKNGSFYFNAIELSIYDFLIQAHLSKEMGFKLPLNAINDIHKAHDWFAKNNPKANLFVVRELRATFKNSPYVLYHNNNMKERKDSLKAPNSNNNNKSKIEKENSEEKMVFFRDNVNENEHIMASFSSFKKFIFKNFLYIFFGLIFVFSVTILLTNQVKERDSRELRRVDLDKNYYKGGKKITQEEYVANRNINLFLIFLSLSIFLLLAFLYLKQRKINLKRKKNNLNYSISDELLKLNRLKEDRILTEEEFNEQKNKLLKQ